MQFIFHRWHGAALCQISLTAMLVGCGTTVPKAPVSGQPAAGEQASVRPAASTVLTPAPAKSSTAAPVLPPAGSGRGAYYLDDGPGEAPPENLLATPDPEPKVEPYSIRGNRPYIVFGKTYTPVTDNQPLKQRGVGSWYGKKFHGQKTSSGELYDMYKMTAAHPTLPIPSYARVTNLNNGMQVIVRVNDRGPFHSSRIIDLSYTAALKLGYLGKGSSQLEVERLLPEEIERIAANGRLPRADPVTDASPPVLAPSLLSDDRMKAEPGKTAATGASPQEPSAELNAILAAFSAQSAEQAKPAVMQSAFGSSANSVYLQLGAYGQPSNAESARSQLLQNWSGKIPPIEVVQTGVLYRVYSGPFESRSDAAAAAQQLHESGNARPTIVLR